MFGGVSVRTRFFVFVVARVGVDPGVDVDVPGKGNPLRWLYGLGSGEVVGRRRPLAIEAADSLASAGGVADFSDNAVGVGTAEETCTAAAGGAFASAGTDMAAGKLGRQFPNVS